MKVLITGGTGFIGMHTARVLLANGIKVRLLIRSEEKMRGLFGDAIEDFVVGDVTDAASVRKALKGCSAVIHTAAMVSIDKRDRERVYATNVGGTHAVIGQACEMGLKKIIHVSSVTALYNPDALQLDGTSPPGTANDAYGASKVECEHYVRDLQEQGYPVHITYPGSVIGPDDPALTEPHQGLKTYLQGFVPIMPSGNQWVDVRDVAEAHYRLLKKRLKPGRYPLGGHYVPWIRLVSILEQMTGRKMMTLSVSGDLVRGVGKVVDFVNARLSKPLDLPLTHEAMVYATNWVPLDDSGTLADLDFELRPVRETLADAICSLEEQGHLSAEQIGRLAS